MLPPFVRVVTLKYPPRVKRVLGDWKGSVRARLTAVILENGVVRTMDPSLPTARALAIAGPYVAGGVGVHETALASPDVVDLGGRCVLPAFTDSHVHFPTWSLAQRQVTLDGCASLDEALARVREAEIPPRSLAARLRLARRRLESLRRADQGGARRGHRRDADDHDLEGLPLRLAELRRARRRRRRSRPRRAASSSATQQGEPTGILREEAAWRFRDRYVLTTEDEWVEATRAGIKLANSRGVAAIHDKDGWLGVARDLPAAARRGEPLAAGLGLDPARPARRARRARRSAPASATSSSGSAT